MKPARQALAAPDHAGLREAGWLVTY